HGGWTLASLTLLTALTALSITWSLSPGDSWVETNRMLAYLAVFAGGLAVVRAAPERWPGMVGGVALGCVLVVAWALLTKVFPGALAPDETFARLRAPFDYWNAIGLMAALAVPPLLWLAAKRSGNLAVNALAYPGLGLAFVCLMLSYSRGALLALFLGLVFWFATVPLRLRAVTALVGSALIAAPVVAWAFSREALTADAAPLLVRTEVGHELGLLLVLMVALLLAAGLAVGFAAANRTPTLRVRRLAGRVLVGVLVLSALTGVAVLASKPGGLDGQISKGWKQMTDPDAVTPSNTPGRLTATASVRARYWDEAIDIWQAHEAAGAGAGSFAVARTRYRTRGLDVRQAHGYVVETLASLGLVGLAVSLALLAAWLASAIRATGFARAGRGLPMDAERVGMLTLASVVLVFGIHSLIDWTWLIPGTATVALLSAAWVAGRGPLRARLAAAPALAAVRRRPGPARGALAVFVVLLAVAGAWAAIQPLRAQHAGDRAFERLDAGESGPALEIARIATERDPLSLEPLYDLAAIQDAVGRSAEAEVTLERAVEKQPASAEAWRRLGEYRALQRRRPKDALAPLRAAYYLDPESTETENAFLLLRRQLAATGQTP
ncbi:MAG TPA: O-antigen ligase family protein, partial [Solirubrobacteraceae bacterium]